MQSDILEKIVRRQTLPDILRELCQIVERESGRNARASILLVDEPARHLWVAAAPSLPGDYVQAINDIEIGTDFCTCSAAAARNTVVITPDIAKDPGWSGLRHLPAKIGMRAVWSMPITSACGGVIGTFDTYFADRREPSAEEQHLVEVLARIAALAIEREQADEALRDSEARYRTMVEASPECVKLIAADGTLLQINPAGLRMLGVRSKADTVGSCIYDVIAPEHRQRYREFNERICTGEQDTIEFDIVTPSGERRSMGTTAVPLPWSDGKFAQLGMTRDVTERVASDRALADSRARLDYAVRVAGVGFWYCDLPFDELVWDDRVKAHFWYPPDAYITIDSFYARIHAEDREPTRVAVETSIQTKSSYDVIYRTVDPETGSVKWIHALGGAAYGENGEPIRFDGVTLDVTSQKLDEQRVSRLNERLREQDRRKDEFLATLAHELRNPLAPLQSGLELLGVGTDPEQQERTRSMMGRQLDHLVRLVDDLLDISRVTLGKVTLRKSRIEFREALDSALEVVGPAIEAHGQKLVVDMPGEKLMLDADATRLAQAIANILVNSVHHTPRGGTISISAQRRESALVMTIADTGAGIDADVLPRIFELFVQAKHPNLTAHQGLGIGLTLVRAFMEMHGGSVTAKSEGPGRGSTFTIRLPLGMEAHTDHDEAENAARVDDGRQLRLLVVDDNVDAAESLSILLELQGHEVVVANSGEEALELVSDFRPQAAFVDIGLPGIDGYEVAARLRQNSRLDGVRLVALTGWGAYDDRTRAYEAGFDLHMVKPATLHAVQAAIADLT